MTAASSLTILTQAGRVLDARVFGAGEAEGLSVEEVREALEGRVPVLDNEADRPPRPFGLGRPRRQCARASLRVAAVSRCVLTRSVMATIPPTRAQPPSSSRPAVKLPVASRR